jgi:hypothetical protein
VLNMCAMIKRLNDSTVKICCGKLGCPIIEDLGDGTVKITDDDGKYVIVKKSEALLLSDGVRTLNHEQLILG